VLTEETLDKRGARLEHTPQKSMRRLAQKTGISKLSAAKVTKQLISTNLNGTESVCVYRNIIFSISEKKKKVS
jgi:LDH2 family malate/lactate/ureidoglycolate dehydrogenase